MTDATTNSLNPDTPEPDIQARQQAGVGAQDQSRQVLPTLIDFRHLPVPMRCAVEMFLLSGDRTKPRLLSLIDHFLTVYGLAACEERQLYTDSAAAHLERIAWLGGEEGF